MSEYAKYWPKGNGWVDAWNGFYLSEVDALDAVLDGLDSGRPPMLRPGEGILSEDEYEERVAKSIIDCYIVTLTLNFDANSGAQAIIMSNEFIVDNLASLEFDVQNERTGAKTAMNLQEAQDA